MTIVWDPVAVPIHSIMFERRTMSRSGGQTLTGVEQVVQSSTDFWTAELKTKLRKPSQRMTYRGYQAQSNGRVGEWIIPVCESYYQAGLIDEWGDDYGSDFDINADGVASGTAVAGSSTLSITMNDSIITPAPGNYFSCNNRLYLLRATTGGSTFTATVVPKLRVTIGASSVIKFSNPTCLMRLADDSTGQADRDMLRFADVTLRFVEVPV